MKKVIIVLPYKLDQDAQQQHIDYIYHTYIEQLVKRGVLPVLCPTTLNQEMIDLLYKDADGLLLLGGADINPALYGQELHPKTKVSTPERDRIEAEVIKRALKDKKPILGICRGMQIVNVVMGGSLHQELSEVCSTEQHMVDPGSSYDDVATYRGQKMEVITGTKLSQIIGSGLRDVHCAHHQAIDKVATDLEISAKSPAGIIEALESKDDEHFILLLENHIETQKEKSQEIWDAFAKEL